MFVKKSILLFLPLILLSCLVQETVILPDDISTTTNNISDKNKNIAKDDTLEITLLEKYKVKILTKVEASKLLKTEDSFTKNLSQFDMESRQKVKFANNKNAYLEFLGNESLDWTNNDVLLLKQIFNSINLKLSSFNLNLPSNINLIKTTGKEEDNAAYTRENSIIIPQNIIDKELTKEVNLENLMLHELFHVYSRFDSHIREKLYNVIGFYQCSELNYPKELKTLKITNPDAYKYNYYITLEERGIKKQFMPMIFAKEPYNLNSSKTFFDYLQFKLMEVKVTTTTEPKYKDGKLTFIDPNLLYFEKIGNNTNYIIHPDEILADNFVFLINGTNNLKSPFVVDKMEKLLSKSKKLSDN